jgi:hypothetical protein
MSGAEQFKAAVSERSGPTDWHGGLERERRKAGQGRAAGFHRCSSLPRTRAACGK